MRSVIIKYSFISLFALSIISCNNEKKEVSTDLVNNPETAAGPVDKENLPVMQFEKETHDFGTITQGEKVSFTYKFKNVGKSDLIISSAKGSCGCTVPDYPKKPIAPGEEAKIDVVFDSEGKSGKQNKSITIVSNTHPNTTVLNLSGEIIAPKEEGKK